ncbi:MAG TPA: ABC transporter permease, partial [Clostridia bacterium]|nr:ABC transporter permease [Clostridia bacterium]
MEEKYKNRALSDEERVAAVQNRRRRITYQNTMLSISAVLLFFIIWQLACSTGLVPSKYLSAPIEVFNLFIAKFTNPDPDGAVLTVNILSSLQVALTGFALAIVIGVPLGLLMGWYRG